jgi:hypothetical protein
MPLLESPPEFENAVKHRIPLQAQNDLDRRQTRLTLDLRENSNAVTDRRGALTGGESRLSPAKQPPVRAKMAGPINDPPRFVDFNRSRPRSATLWRPRRRVGRAPIGAAPN